MFAVPAHAQYSQALFLELARDPGRADVPKTAASLALAGVPLRSGTADEAVVRPGSLMLGRGTDLVVSYGSFFYRREELTSTPNQLPPFDPSRRLSPQSSTAVGYMAAATRRANWAAAAFYDASARQGHAFTTDSATLVFASLFPTLLHETATGTASLHQSTVRLGGSVAVGGRRVAAGISVSAVRLEYVARALDEITITSRSIPDPSLKTFCCRVDEDRVEIRDWAPAFALSGIVRPSAHLTLTARWRAEPAFTTVRELSIVQGLQRQVQTDDVKFRPPAAYAVGAIALAGSTSVTTELARHLYEDVFSPLAPPAVDAGFRCGAIAVSLCGGWGFPYHATKNTTTIKVAVEHAIGVGSGRLALRGGFAYEPGYTLARRADHASTRRELRFPSPPVVSEFEPPRESLTWISAGVGYEWPRTEIAFGIGRAKHQTRVLVDVRLRSR